MPIIQKPHGIGEQTGDQLVTCEPLHMQLTYGVLFVHHTGNDAFSGLDKAEPFATLGAAVGASGVGDIVVMLPGHTETIAATIEIGGRIIAGAGTSGGHPTVHLTNNQAAAPMLTVSGFYPTQLLNVWLEDEMQANTEPKIRVPETFGAHTSYFRIRGCYIEGGPNDGGACLFLGGGEGPAGFVEIRETTFISVGTGVAAQPLCAITTDNVTVPYGLIMDGVVFDNGPYGWHNGTTHYSVDIGDPIGSVHLERVTLSHGADARLSAFGGCYGYINAYPSHGGGRIDWVPTGEIVSLPHGIGEVLGDQLATITPLLINCDTDQGVWWVHHTGKDTYAGLDRYKPFATLTFALTVAAQDDIIVLLDGHTETITAPQEISSFTILGAGQTADGKPTVHLTNNQAAGAMFTLGNRGGVMTQLLNVWIEEQAQACTEPKIRVGLTASDHYGHFRIRGCYIECGATDLNTAIMLGQGAAKINNGFVEIRDTVIISTATDREAQPLSAIECAGQGAPPELLVTDGLTVDGGTAGWSNYHAIDFSDMGWFFVWMENVALPHGSDAHMGYTWGHINVNPSDGGGRIDWLEGQQ